MTLLRILLISAFATAAASAQQPSRGSSRPPANAPRLVPVAETRLLMEGMTNANYLGLEKILKSNEIDKDHWTFARGQALLIAESGNLLMMRPPRNSGQDAWMKAAAELRESATQLARAVTSQDVERSRLALVTMSNTCNNCHQTFRVPQRISPFEAKP